MRFGRAHFDILEGDAGRKALRVVIAQLRKLLPEPARITSIPGWGYELTIEKD